MLPPYFRNIGKRRIEPVFFLIGIGAAEHRALAFRLLFLILSHDSALPETTLPPECDDRADDRKHDQDQCDDAEHDRALRDLPPIRI